MVRFFSRGFFSYFFFFLFFLLVFVFVFYFFSGGSFFGSVVGSDYFFYNDSFFGVFTPVVSFSDGFFSLFLPRGSFVFRRVFLFNFSSGEWLPFDLDGHIVGDWVFDRAFVSLPFSSSDDLLVAFYPCYFNYSSFQFSCSENWILYNETPIDINRVYCNSDDDCEEGVCLTAGYCGFPHADLILDAKYWYTTGDSSHHEFSCSLIDNGLDCSASNNNICFDSIDDKIYVVLNISVINNNTNKIPLRITSFYNINNFNKELIINRHWVLLTLVFNASDLSFLNINRGYGGGSVFIDFLTFYNNDDYVKDFTLYLNSFYRDSCSSISSSNCGNSIIDNGEQCDGANLNSETCITLGFDGGTLSCNSDCSFDTSNCYNNPSSSEICSNNIDDDKDGLVDCADSDCSDDIICDFNQLEIYDPDKSFHALETKGYFNTDIGSFDFSDVLNNYDISKLKESSYLSFTTNEPYHYGLKSFVELLDFASKKVYDLTKDWDYGSPIAKFGDLSEKYNDHLITPGVSELKPRHPGSSHDYGSSADLIYYIYHNDFNNDYYNELRSSYSVCSYNEYNYCSSDPYLLDPYRTALFLMILKVNNVNHFIVDEKILPYLLSASEKINEKIPVLPKLSVNDFYTNWPYHNTHVHISFFPSLSSYDITQYGLLMNYSYLGNYNALLSYVYNYPSNFNPNFYSPDNIRELTDYNNYHTNALPYYSFFYAVIGFGSDYSNQKRLMNIDLLYNLFDYCQDYRIYDSINSYNIYHINYLIHKPGSASEDNDCKNCISDNCVVGDLKCDNGLKQCVEINSRCTKWVNALYLMKGRSCENNEHLNAKTCDGQTYLCVKLEGESTYRWHLKSSLVDAPIPCTTFEYPYDNLWGYFKRDALDYDDPDERYVLNEDVNNDYYCRIFRKRVLHLPVD